MSSASWSVTCHRIHTSAHAGTGVPAARAPGARAAGLCCVVPTVRSHGRHPATAWCVVTSQQIDGRMRSGAFALPGFSSVPLSPAHPACGADHTTSCPLQTDLLQVAQGSARHLPWDGGVLLGLEPRAWGLHGEVREAMRLAQQQPVVWCDPRCSRVTLLGGGCSGHRGRMMAGPFL